MVGPTMMAPCTPFMGQQYMGAQMMVPQMMPQMVPQMLPQMMGIGGMGGWPQAPMGMAQMPMQHQDMSQSYYDPNAVSYDPNASSYDPNAASYYDPVASFMQQLGIDPSEEQTFGWIAELGLQSPLPPRWESCADPSTGCTYYVDTDKQTSSWENPWLPHLQRIIELGRLFLQNPADDGFFYEAKQILWQEHKEELDLWHGPFQNGAGQEYFVNSSSGTACARDPRADAQYVFELESSFLSSLEEVLAPQPLSPGTPGRNWGQQDGDQSGDMWRTEAGAEVLTLDADASLGDSIPSREQNTERALKRLATLKAIAHCDHHSTLQSMSQAAWWLRLACSEEEEVQRLRLTKLAKLKRSRRGRRTGSQNGPPPPSLAELSLPPAPLLEGLAGQEENKSPMPARLAPKTLAFDEDEHPFALTTGSLGSQLSSLVLPPAGWPSPANMVRPPPSALGLVAASASPLLLAAEATPADAPLPPVGIPSSLSLHRRSPGREFAAESFLASAVAAVDVGRLGSGAVAFASDAAAVLHAAVGSLQE